MRQPDERAVLDSIGIELAVLLKRRRKRLLIADSAALRSVDEPLTVVRVSQVPVLALIAGDPADLSLAPNGSHMRFELPYLLHFLFGESDLGRRDVTFHMVDSGGAGNR